MPILSDDPRLKRCGYARLFGDGGKLDFVMRKPEILLGRHSKSTTVDVPLAEHKAVSREHAHIRYNFDKKQFELEVVGKNGVRINGVDHKPGQPGGNEPVPLVSQTMLQIGDDLTFYFLLPKDPKDVARKRKLGSMAMPPHMAPALKRSATVSSRPASTAVAAKAAAPPDVMRMFMHATQPVAQPVAAKQAEAPTQTAAQRQQRVVAAKTVQAQQTAALMQQQQQHLEQQRQAAVVTAAAARPAGQQQQPTVAAAPAAAGTSQPAAAAGAGASAAAAPPAGQQQQPTVAAAPAAAGTSQPAAAAGTGASAAATSASPDVLAQAQQQVLNSLMANPAQLQQLLAMSMQQQGKVAPAVTMAPGGTVTGASPVAMTAMQQQQQQHMMALQLQAQQQAVLQMQAQAAQQAAQQQAVLQMQAQAAQQQPGASVGSASTAAALARLTPQQQAMLANMPPQQQAAALQVMMMPQQVAAAAGQQELTPAQIVQMQAQAQRLAAIQALTLPPR